MERNEEEILKFWQSEDIFKKSVEQRKGNKTFVFFEGPPTANGLPHIGHAQGRAFKDIIPRYKTMRGYFVPRRAGWDTQGLPVEIEVEKVLGLKTKKEIEEYGIAAFNQKCKESVWKYKDAWKEFSDRIGYWVDNEHAYVTYDNSYLESLWWIIKRIWDRGLLYEDHKILPWCTRCGTGLSSHELAQEYQNISDTSFYVKFRLLPGQRVGDIETDDDTYIVSWTTTPWTLPGNVALAVGEQVNYRIIRFRESPKGLSTVHSGETYIFANTENSGERVFGVPIDHVIDERGVVSGKALLNLCYEPLFDISTNRNVSSHRVYGADFVTIDDGTGVVHIAPMYGEDDYQLGKTHNLPLIHTVDETGRFAENTQDLYGMHIKEKGTDEYIFGLLNEKNQVLRSEVYTHDYPFCWRCKSPVIYYARKSWWIAMSKLREELMRRNNNVHWIPKHLKEGRFGSWISEVKDWAFSRARFWGTPLPIWKCTSCEEVKVVESIKELLDATVPFRNIYVLMRHGESESNVKGIAWSKPDGDIYPLTEKGRGEVQAAAHHIKKAYGIPDVILSSPLLRTKETAKTVAQTLGLDDDAVHIEPRLQEYGFGVYDGKPIQDHLDYFSSREEQFEKALPGGESFKDIRLRVLKLLGELEKTYAGKTILLVSHAAPIWLLETGCKGLNGEESLHHAREKLRTEKYIANAEVRLLEGPCLPINEHGHLDLHRPYIDQIHLLCPTCQGHMERVPELADVWFDSGGMPFASWHYPFTHQIEIDSGEWYPADYISEAIDQTRGWFYTLLAVATLLEKEAPYRTVVSQGHVLDKNGKKMSKSIGNVVSPMEIMEKHGADVLRWYFFTINQPGDTKNFDEQDLINKRRAFLDIFWNSYVFWKTYPSSEKQTSFHILDKWILLRLHEIMKEMTASLDAYDIVGAARLLEEFVGEDLSRWYIRRSRTRIKDGEKNVLHEVLEHVALLSAPFIPFHAEMIYQGLGNTQSVHLADWPHERLLQRVEDIVSGGLLQQMTEVRRIVSLGLEERAKAGIKVRQPLLSMRFGSRVITPRDQDLLEIIQDELNVKSVELQGEGNVELDTTITDELREEGDVRELVRRIQQARKEAKLAPGKIVNARVGAPEVLRKHVQYIQKEANLSEITWSDGEEIIFA